jgi:O-antigen ligase/tetratricopeptide (TPR) repeat protein
MTLTELQPSAAVETQLHPHGEPSDLSNSRPALETLSPDASKATESPSQIRTSRQAILQALTLSRFNSAIEWLLVALLVIAPLAFGSVDAWSEEIVLLLASALAATFTLKLILHPHQPFIWSWTYLPLALFLSLIALQVIPLPASLVHLLSPAAYRIQNDHPFTAPIPRFSTLSLYPAETIREFRLLLAVSAVFIVSVNQLRSSNRIVKLLAAVALVGVTEAVLNLAQFISGTDKVLWVVPMAHLNSGTFAGHAHFGQLINLACGAMVAIALIRLSENRPSGRKNNSDTATILFDRRYQLIWLMIVCIIVAFTAMCISMTRGGMLAALLAALISIGIATFRSQQKGKTAYIILGVVGIGCLLLLTGFDQVFDRVATLGDLQKSIDVRPQIFHDLIPAFKAFPLLGTGLGTHATVYPMFQTILVPAIAYNTDNEYVQILEETGFLGLSIMLSFLGMIVLAYFKILKRRPKPIRTAAIGLGFGITAILIQSFSDFGQQLPSLALITAVFCAILVVLATQNSDGDPLLSASDSRIAFFYRIPALVLILTISCFAILLPADRNRRAESAWKTALNFDQVARAANWQASDDIYAGLIDSTSQAVKLKPDDVRYAYWLSVYRWQSVARTVAGPVDPALINLRKQVGARVVSDLLTLTQLCPTYAAPYATAAQIEFATLSRPDIATTFMQKALQLGRSDPAILMPAAELDIHLGNAEASVPLLRDCVKADNSWNQHAADLLLAQDRSDLAIKVCQGKADQLTNILVHLPAPGKPATPTQAASRIQLLSEITQLSQQPDTSPWVLATLASSALNQNDPATATKYYQRALEKDYRQVDWRLGLARALVACGQTDQAIAEIRACERMAPQRNDVRDYLQELLNNPHPKPVRGVG